MHNAPSVIYPVGRLLLERVVTLAWTGLALAAMVTMVVAQPWGWGPALTLCRDKEKRIEEGGNKIG